MTSALVEIDSDVNERKLRLLLKDCAMGFYQQMYFWGKDVSHLKGNQLQEYGFVKSPSTGLKGTSCYTLKGNAEVIELYGSCAGYYSEISRVVFLRKKCRFYRWLPDSRLIAGQWSQEDIISADASALFEDLLPLLRWWANYEKWIEARFGERYRKWCYAEWKKVKGKVPWLPPGIILHWLEQFIEKKDLADRPKKFV